MVRVLVVDRDRTVLHSVRQALARVGIQASTIGSVRRALVQAQEQRPDLIICDAHLAADSSWNALLGPAKATAPRLIALADGNAPRLMIEAAQRGAVEVLPKPLDYLRLSELAQRLLAEASVGGGQLAEADFAAPFVAQSAAMHDVMRSAGRAASCDLAVLLTGESGSGKTQLARIIQRHGTRAAAAYVEVETAGKAADRLLDELFGHERGAFAAAVDRRLGWIERCDGGTLLLEQVDTLPMQAQGRLLAVVEEQSLRRVGGEESRPVDVRILATARKDFERLLSAGKYRTDLYHDLREVAITLPPLRERLDELPRLAASFLSRLQTSAGMPGPRAMAADALDALRSYHWPGNLWELESVLRAASWRCQGGIIVADDLPEPLRPIRPAAVRGVDLPAMQSFEAYLSEAFTTDAGEIYQQAVAFFDRYICGRVLEHTSGNQSHAARVLGITRRSLRTKIRRFDLAHLAGPRRPRRRK